MMVVPQRNQEIRTKSRRDPAGGFTLVEILVALCVVLLALVPLLRFHVVSIRVADTSRRLARATLVADGQLAEILAQEVPEVGQRRGQVEDDDTGTVFRWTSVVTDTPPAGLQDVGLKSLHEVNVSVAWEDSGRDAVVSVHTLVHIGTPGSEEISVRSQETPEAGVAPLAGSPLGRVEQEGRNDGR